VRFITSGNAEAAKALFQRLLQEPVLQELDGASEPAAAVATGGLQAFHCKHFIASISLQAFHCKHFIASISLQAFHITGTFNSIDIASSRCVMHVQRTVGRGALPARTSTMLVQPLSVLAYRRQLWH
jgi:hypothetical protein